MNAFFTPGVFPFLVYLIRVSTKKLSQPLRNAKLVPLELSKKHPSLRKYQFASPRILSCGWIFLVSLELRLSLLARWGKGGPRTHLSPGRTPQRTCAIAGSCGAAEFGRRGLESNGKGAGGRGLAKVLEMRLRPRHRGRSRARRPPSVGLQAHRRSPRGPPQHGHPQAVSDARAAGAAERDAIPGAR